MYVLKKCKNSVCMSTLQHLAWGHLCTHHLKRGQPMPRCAALGPGMGQPLWSWFRAPQTPEFNKVNDLELVSNMFYYPPARWGLLDFIRVVLLLLLLFLLVLLLLHHLCLHFHVHFRLANSSPSSSPTSARSGHCWTSTARVWAHWAPLDLNLGPSELSENRWTSTWDRPSSVSTAGPQPGTLRAQWAPLDLNLGPSELSEHRWPSTAR